MRIRVNGRVCAPETSLAGVVGDHKSEALLFIFNEVPQGTLYLKTELDDVTDKIALDAVTEREFVCKLERKTIPKSGILKCQLVTEQPDPDDGEDVIIWQTRRFELRVERRIDAETPIETQYPTLLVQWEARMKQYAENVEKGGIEYTIEGDRIGLKGVNEAEWQYTPNLTGPAGPTGAAGPAGPEGPAGPTGAPGVYILADGELPEDAPEDADVVIDPEGEEEDPESGITQESDPTVPAWAKAPAKPAYTAAEVGADPAGAAAAAVAAHNTDAAAHNDLRLELAQVSARLTAFFDSDDQTLDELSEIVAYITSNKSLIDAVTTSKVSVADIVDNLTTNVANRPLSAAQGVVLKGLIDTLRSELPAVPVQSVNGKTGAVQLTAADVDAYDKAAIDAIMGSYITDIDTLIGGDA